MESKSHQDMQSIVSRILSEASPPMEKVQRIVNLGYDEEEADMLVERYQSGMRQPVFYEELPKAEYADTEDRE